MGDVFYKNGVRMFDFGLQTGDVFEMNPEEHLIVTEVCDTVLQDGVSRKCLTMSRYNTETSEAEDVSDKWIEGIGSLNWGIYSTSAIMGTRATLQSVRTNGEVIYQRGETDSTPIVPIINKVSVSPEAPTIEDEIIYSVELGIFMENYTYEQKLDSIVGQTIYVSGTYSIYASIAMFPINCNLPLGKLSAGSYTIRHSIKGLNGTAPTEIDTTFTNKFYVTYTARIGNTAVEKPAAKVQASSSTLISSSPTASKFEVYTLDAVKVGEATFAGGEAKVQVGKTPAAYLYIITYPDGRRESGKVMVK